MSIQEVQLALFCLLAICIPCTLWYRRRSNTNSLPYPPGPKGVPILGNIWDLPETHAWLRVAEWKKTYGDIIHLRAFGQHTIFINSLDAAIELMEKRSTKYSDRPRLVMLNEIAGWDWTFAFMAYGPSWRKGRRMFHQAFHSGVAPQYLPAHLLEARLLLSRLLTSPDEFLHHARHLTASTIMRITYGIEVSQSNDEYIKMAEKAGDNLNRCAVPGSFIVDFLPILKYVPSWFPGATFKKLGKVWSAEVEEARTVPFLASRNAIASGKSTETAVAKMFQYTQKEDSEDAEEEVMNVTGIAFTAGADTTSSVLQFFFLAMVLNPEVQAKAQAQVDSIVGTDRLPEFDDISALPYVEALVMEIMRWHPPAPFPAAHAISEDDEYKGYFIPKGAIIAANIWPMCHDETVYPQPSEFRPERFLDRNGQIDKDVQSPTAIVFGFGRRICPGRHVATNAIIIAVASILSAFNIEYAYDERGPIPVKGDDTSGLISFPADFKCKITPRRENTAGLIKNSLEVLRS